MKLKFHKMQGIGNDFVLLDYLESNGKYELLFLNDFKFLLDRHRGIGGDQLIVLLKGDNIIVKIFNPDGSESAMCGNALRCVAKYLHEYRLYAAKNKVKIGDAELNIEAIELGKYRVEMPLPIFFEDVSYKHKYLRHGLVTEIGNPHVFFIRDSDNINEEILKEEVLAVKQDRINFPNGVNVGYGQIVKNLQESEDIITLRVFERGVESPYNLTGETQACGSGATAAAILAFRNDMVSQKSAVHLSGGILQIMIGGIKSEINSVQMQGDASYVFCGEIDI